MAITNHERVGKSLELLKAGLGPFVERELKARYGDGWAFEAKDALSDTRLGAGKNESLQDVAALLVIMDRKWGEVFRHILGKTERSLVNEIIAVRNRWAHQEPFSSDDAYRALDSAERLLSAVSAPAGRGGGQDEDGAAARALRRAGAQREAQVLRHRHRERGDGQPQALARGGDAPRGRGQRPLPAGRVRRRPVAGASGRGHGRVPRPGGVLPPHLSDREPQGDAGGRGAAPDGWRRRSGGPVADQLRRRQDPLHAGALPPVLRHRTDRAGRHRRGDGRSRGQQGPDRPAGGAGGQQDFARQPERQTRRHGGPHPVG